MAKSTRSMPPFNSNMPGNPVMATPKPKVAKPSKGGTAPMVRRRTAPMGKR